MSLTLMSSIESQRMPLAISVEADVDLGVTSRLLDLLIVQNFFPSQMSVHREGTAMTVTVSLPVGHPGEGRLLAKMHQIPGVRQVKTTKG